MISALDLGWAAGFIAGDGHFDYSKTSTCRVRVCQIERAPLDKLAALFGGSIWASRHYVNRHGPQIVWMWTAYGQTAAGLAMTLWPLWSPQRKEQVKAMLLKWRAGRPTKPLRTTCPSGHEYTAANTHIEVRKDGGRGRKCRTCNAARWRRSYAAKRSRATEPQEAS